MTVICSIPDVNMDLTKKGRARPSYGHGAGCTEVGIDCLTGIHYVSLISNLLCYLYLIYLLIYFHNLYFLIIIIIGSIE